MAISPNVRPVSKRTTPANDLRDSSSFQLSDSSTKGPMYKASILSAFGRTCFHSRWEEWGGIGGLGGGPLFALNLDTQEV